MQRKEDQSIQMIDHTNQTGAIVCPYCGKKNEDTNYRIDGYMEGQEICDKCGEKYKFSSDIVIYWTTEKILPDNETEYPK